MKIVKISELQKHNPNRANDNGYLGYFCLEGDLARIVINDLEINISPHLKNIIYNLKGENVYIREVLPVFVMIGNVVLWSSVCRLVALTKK